MTRPIFSERNSVLSKYEPNGQQNEKNVCLCTTCSVLFLALLYAFRDWPHYYLPVL